MTIKGQDATEIKWEQIDCPICNSSVYYFFMRLKDLYYFYPEEFTLVKCKDCRLVYLNPRPTENCISHFYPLTYNLEENYQEPQGRINARIHAVNSIIKTGRVMDIGCGRGDFLHQLKLGGFEVLGIDVSKAQTEYGNKKYGLNLICGDFLRHTFPTEWFDCITLFHSLEHFHSPVEYINKVYSVLKKNGTIFISVPNANSLQAALFKKYWPGWDPPRHLVTFDRQNLASLLKKSGFEVLAVQQDWDSKWAFSESLRRTVLYKILLKKNTRTETGQRMENPVQHSATKLTLSKSLSLFTYVFIYAEKLLKSPGCIKVIAVKR